ncbi:TetR family transcriptional regulator [Nocardia sp. 004]|uniref:TetR family transcriptional regulator n=1 Tax=Nocardia sp. 004 TaxID=3385978 RepID=UPI0039A38817
MLETSTPMGADAAATGTPNAPSAKGLRERKKQQTRSRIISAALDLCDKQGFDATTVEQIAHVADISPRTVNRYFDSKEDIVLGPTEDFDLAVATALRELPHTGNELEALRDAFLRVIDQAGEVSGTDPLSFRRLQQMQRIVRSSPSVNARSLEYTEGKHGVIAVVLAERLGVEPNAREVQLILRTWQLIGHVSVEYSGAQFLHEDIATAAEAEYTAFTETFDAFVRACCSARTSACQ